ncbi:HtaA domain-containing protein [Glycomyces sp. NPDC048151]|uniref:HtaA domain-containing protein n=1 Tax=Glycomyces sp. NPDC048151 TaxID=3364002 RepID=UPI003716E4B9
MPHATARLTGALVAAAALIASLLLWAAPANAEDLSGGRLDWGVKESFRSYITGSIAKGEVQTGDGASAVDGAYRFHSATGTYEDGIAAIDYTGWVYFWGHDGELDLTFANPSVEYSGSSGTLYVYVNGTRTDMASLSGAELSVSGGTLSVSGASATLTANGAEAFAGYYEPGEQLDPVSFSADIAAAEAPTTEAAESPTAAAETDQVGGAVLDWGVRTSWRDYVSGDIANGEWAVSGGAADGGAVFRFTEGSGTATAADYTLSYKGTVAFTGTDVDLALTDPVVTATGGKGVLSAEVAGTRVDLVAFEATLAESGGLLLAENVPTVLTEAAVPVFGGYYQAGDAMDPLTIAIPLTADAAVPALPDLGAEPEQPAPSESASPLDADDAAEDTGANPLVWIVPAALVVLFAAAAITVALVQRAKRNRAAQGDPQTTVEEAKATDNAPADTAAPSEPTPSETEGPADQGPDPAASSTEDPEADKES